MKPTIAVIGILLLSDCSSVERQAAAGDSAAAKTIPAVHLPWKEAGLTERQAAAHLLDRFAFGAVPGEIDEVTAEGIDRWFIAQLRSDKADRPLSAKLSTLHSLQMTNDEIASLYPPPGQIYLMALQEGVISDDGLGEKDARKKYFDELREFAQKKGIRRFADLKKDLIAQKILRARYSENQLREVLTDFWFNHFNVSITDNQCRSFVLTYERDVIRPNVFGSFRALLGSVAKHPAMLTYLDNAQSTSEQGVPTTMSVAVDRFKNQGALRGKAAQRRIRDALKEREAMMAEVQKGIPDEFKPKKGINENYARELLELHTLGVDGGYTQSDVVNVARAFSGWSVYPAGPQGMKVRERLDKRMDRAKNAGFIREGNFFFRADNHDAEEKTVLGKIFASGGGMEEGEQVMDIAARHPSTARHIARKMAVRFVSDDPSEALVEDLSDVFRRTDGDLTAMVIAVAESPEFWSAGSRRAKIKTPFEYVLSALRATDADVRQTRETAQWLERLGEPLFACHPPTGYSEKADTWVNSGALLNRMNFGLNLAANRIKGITVDLAALNRQREPESSTAAVETYSAILLPERNTDDMKSMIEPMAKGKNIAETVESKNERLISNSEMSGDGSMMDEDAEQQSEPEKKTEKITERSVLAQIVGIIIGSPEFQRR